MQTIAQQIIPILELMKYIIRNSTTEAIIRNPLKTLFSYVLISSDAESMPRDKVNEIIVISLAHSKS